MKKELDDQLVQTYPKLFVQRSLPMTESCMYWGFDCSDGWFKIIDRLCSRIQSHIDQRAEQREFDLRYNKIVETAKQGDFKLFEEYYSRFLKESLEEKRAKIVKEEPRSVIELVPQVVVTQVKEKFGTLRFYYAGGDRFIDGLVSMAEEMSSITCEICGSPGELRGKGWLYTACDEHRDENNC